MTTALIKPIADASALEIEDASARLLRMFAEGKSQLTKDAYAQDVARLQAYLQADTPAKAAATLFAAGPGGANMIVLRMIDGMKEAKLSPATINRTLTSLNALMKTARIVGAITWRLEVPREKAEPYRDTRGPGRDAIDAMMAKLGDDALGLRNKAILRLLYMRGLRRKEVVTLNVEHFNPEFRKEKGKPIAALSVLGKMRKAREWFTVPETARRDVMRWLKVHPKPENGEPLFPALDHANYGKRMGGHGVYHMVRDLGDKVKVRARPHAIRHTAITDVLDRSGGDLRKAQKFSRHHSTDTLLIYDDNRQDFGKEMADLLEDDE